MKPEHITTDATLRDDLIDSLRLKAMQDIVAHTRVWQFTRATVTDTLNAIEIELATLRKHERGED